MARFADYVDTDYLPGDVRRGAYGDAPISSILESELSKQIKFRPRSDIAGKYLEEFYALSQNPSGFAQREMKLPADFVAFAQMVS
jgi:hypothetical protein